MSSDTDRIPVPTNGRGPHSSPVAATAPSGARTGTDTDPGGPTSADPGGPTSAEFSVAFTPKQLAVGFGIIASLILLLVRARRRRPGA